AGAQQSSATASKPSPTTPVPTPIPLSEIASEAQSTAQSVHNIEASLSTDKITATVEERLPQLRNEIELRETETTKLLAASLPLQYFHYLEVFMQRLGDELSTWNHDLTGRGRTLDGQITQLDKLSKIWKSTLQLPELSKTPPEIP